MGDSLGAPLEFSGYNTREADTVTELDNDLFMGRPELQQNSVSACWLRAAHIAIIAPPPPARAKEIMGAGFNRFGVKAGQWTDDTSMALCLADSLLTHYPDFDPVGASIGSACTCKLVVLSPLLRRLLPSAKFACLATFTFTHRFAPALFGVVGCRIQQRLWLR